MRMEKSCWTCGHFLIGGGCWKDSNMGEAGRKNVEVDHVCDSWVEEGTKGTVTDFGELTEGERK